MLSSTGLLYHFVWIMALVITAGVFALAWISTRNRNEINESDANAELTVAPVKVENTMLVFHVHKIHPNISVK